MRDLSLHILDLIENSIRAGAAVVQVRLAAQPDKDSLTIMVEDDGCGFQVSPEQAMDPFYTTKTGKRTGLGLSLFQAAAQQAGGSLLLGRSTLGGAAVTATMGLRHVDRSPLGDLAASIASVVCTHPQLDVRLELQIGEQCCSLRSADLAGRPGLATARKMSHSIQAKLKSMSLA